MQSLPPSFPPSVPLPSHTTSDSLTPGVHKQVIQLEVAQHATSAAQLFNVVNDL